MFISRRMSRLSPVQIVVLRKLGPGITFLAILGLLCFPCPSIELTLDFRQPFLYILAMSRAERNCTSRAEGNCTTERRGVSIKVSSWPSSRSNLILMVT